MRKGRSGNFGHPKGKPSGNGRETGGLKSAFAITGLEEDDALANKYMAEPDKLAAGISMRHLNRNTDKEK